MQASRRGAKDVPKIYTRYYLNMYSLNLAYRVLCFHGSRKFLACHPSYPYLRRVQFGSAHPSACPPSHPLPFGYLVIHSLQALGVPYVDLVSKRCNHEERKRGLEKLTSIRDRTRVRALAHRRARVSLATTLTKMRGSPAAAAARGHGRGRGRLARRRRRAAAVGSAL